MMLEIKIIAGLAVFSALNRRAEVVQQQVAITDYLHDPTTWGADQWARLYADDLYRHGAQSSFTAYGLDYQGFQR
ncbi:MAG TPA: hypothetical protein VF800_11670 [Telluria sp.]|jgi:hypothetical protein